MNKDEIDKIMENHWADEIAARKRPTINPPRLGFWFVYKLYGVLFRQPARALWNWFAYWDYACPCHGSPRLDDFGWCLHAQIVYRFPISERVKEWLNGCSYKRPFRLWLNHLLLWSYACPCCGSDAWADDTNDEWFECVFSREGSGPDGRTFEFGGWAFCIACGTPNWYEDSGP